MSLSHDVRKDTMLVCPFAELSFSAPTGHHCGKCALFCLALLLSLGNKTLATSSLPLADGFCLWCWLSFVSLHLLQCPLPSTCICQELCTPSISFLWYKGRECNFYPVQYPYWNLLSLNFFVPSVQMIYRTSVSCLGGQCQRPGDTESPSLSSAYEISCNPPALQSLISHKQKLYSQFVMFF